MKLDEQQKEEFMSYWGYCPLIETKSNKIVSIQSVERVSPGKYHLVGHRIEIEKDDVDGNPLVGPNGDPILFTDSYYSETFDHLEPYFVPTGYYQVSRDEAYWFTRKPDRSMVKGVSKNNIGMLSIQPLIEGQKDLIVEPRDWNLMHFARIYYGLCKDYKSDLKNSLIELALKKSNAKTKFDPYDRPIREGFTVALSRNVALVSHLTYEIPVVMYKLNPVGFYADDVVYISKDKDIAKQLIEEETGLITEVYAS